MTADVREVTPNPGSYEAIERGCCCPRMDNRNGQGIPTLEGPLFWLSENCPLHAKVEVRDHDD